MKKELLKNIGIYAGILLLFVVLAYSFTPQVLDGKIVNQGTPAEVLDNTTEPHTLRLLDDIPEVHKTKWIKNSHRSKK